MAAFRFLAALFLLVATVALVSDATPWLTGTGGFAATAFSEQWARVSPSSLKAAQEAVSRATAPWVWDGVLGHLIGVPTFVLFGVLAACSGYAGRRHRRVNIYQN